MRVQWNSREPQICSYCGEICIAVREHVIAKRFFSKHGLERGDLVIVPSCSACNAKKEIIETLVSTFLPFTTTSESARRVLDEHIENELNTNGALKKRYLKYKKLNFSHKNGKFVKIATFYFDEEMQNNFHIWTEYVVRGLYKAHSGGNINIDIHDKINVRRYTNKHHIDFWRRWIENQENSAKERIANGEATYIFAFDNINNSSSWIIEFYGIVLLAFTYDESMPHILQNIEERAVEQFSLQNVERLG